MVREDPSTVGAIEAEAKTTGRKGRVDDWFALVVAVAIAGGVPRGGVGVT